MNGIGPNDIKFGYGVCRAHWTVNYLLVVTTGKINEVGRWIVELSDKTRSVVYKEFWP